ncbi:anti-sigma factor domain-containing protein [Streptomyces sp. NPDC051684]|uniref:anti-sigma factor n=1 Tax=Streptomyces sp. NPDC051684 TaxID=3365670 RepID=UPI0037B254CC
MTAADLHTLTGAYALHALSDDERADFEQHLAHCEACAQESAELTATAARLGLAATAAPRPELRGRVLRRITTVRQESPRERALSRAGRTAGAGRRLLPRWALAACFVAASALGGTAAWQYERAEDAQQQARQAEAGNDRIAAVLAAPDARTGSARLGDGASGTVVVSKSQDRAVFIASGMAHPPQGKVYQLWYDDGGTMRSAGLMDTARSDQAVLLSGGVDGASGMGITVEPAGGSDRPTTDPVALMPLPA